MHIKKSEWGGRKNSSTEKVFHRETQVKKFCIEAFYKKDTFKVLNFELKLSS